MDPCISRRDHLPSRKWESRRGWWQVWGLPGRMPAPPWVPLRRPPPPPGETGRSVPQACRSPSPQTEELPHLLCHLGQLFCHRKASTGVGTWSGMTLGFLQARFVRSKRKPDSLLLGQSEKVGHYGWALAGSYSVTLKVRLCLSGHGASSGDRGVVSKWVLLSGWVSLGVTGFRGAYPPPRGEKGASAA